MPRPPRLGDQVAGQEAGGRALDPGEAEREQDGVGHHRGGLGDQDRPVHRERDGDRGQRQPARGTLAVARRHQGEGHRQRGPRGGLHGRGQAQGQASQDDPQHRPELGPQHRQQHRQYGPERAPKRGPLGRAASQQRQAHADQGQHGQVVTARGKRERDDRRGGDHRRPQPGPPHPAQGQRAREPEDEHHPEPQPRIGEQAAAEEGVRNPEHGQRRQVRVVDVRIVRGGHGVAGLVGRAVVQEQPGRMDDHADFRLPPPGPGHPGQRHDYRPGQADHDGDPAPWPASQQGGQGREAVRAGRQDAPQPLRRVGAEHGDRAREQRAHGQQDGGPARAGGPRARERVPLPPPAGPPLPLTGPVPPPPRPPRPPGRPGRGAGTGIVAGVPAWRAGQR